MDIISAKGASPDKVYKLLIHNTDVPIYITIIDDNKSYEVNIDEQDVQKFSILFEASVSQYTHLLLELLHFNGSSYIMVANEELILFKNKCIKYFTKKINEVNHVETLQKCLNHVHQEHIQLTEQVLKLTEYNRKLNEELNTLKHKIEECIENADERENCIYSSFIQVLNEKKQHIQYLHNFICKDIVAKSPLDNVTKSKHKIDISDSESDMYNTDEDKEERKRFKEYSGTSKVVPIMDIDSRVFDSDSDDDSKSSVLPQRTLEENDATIHIIHNTCNNFETANSESQSQHEKIMITSTDTPVAIISTQDLFDKI